MRMRASASLAELPLSDWEKSSVLPLRFTFQAGRPLAVLSIASSIRTSCCTRLSFSPCAVTRKTCENSSVTMQFCVAVGPPGMLQSCSVLHEVDEVYHGTQAQLPVGQVSVWTTAVLFHHASTSVA